jgi:hypothetical protein
MTPFQTSGKINWKWDWPIAKPTHDNAVTPKYGHISMNSVGTEPLIAMLQLAKTVYAYYKDIEEGNELRKCTIPPQCIIIRSKNKLYGI